MVDGHQKDAATPPRAAIAAVAAVAVRIRVVDRTAITLATCLVAAGARCPPVG